ncbi:MAG: hypothetical protein D3916_12435 [Candidatus Electrothrix sp. MAN1_4]|nr:hypothetical protein [Candidatus Electrothrix sp. MAN1_4]
MHQEISAACRRADTLLWAAFMRSQQDDVSGSPTGKLVFPKYRDGSLRVSEQEARFAFVEALCSGPLLYSVEAPTSKGYQFTGDSECSAQTDLAILDATMAHICNVEFKAKGVSSTAKEHSPISKDVQKLLREPLWGLWFHLLEGVDSSTINKFLIVITKEIEHVRSKFADIEAPGLTIHICVLRHGFSVQRDVVFAGGEMPDAEELRQMLQLDVQVSRSELLTERDLNGWDVQLRKPA